MTPEYSRRHQGRELCWRTLNSDEIPPGIVPASPSPFLLKPRGRNRGRDLGSPERRPSGTGLCITRELCRGSGSTGERAKRGPSSVFELALEESEFRVTALPKAQTQFSKTNSAAWRDAVVGDQRRRQESKDLADLIFFMQHRDRVVSGSWKTYRSGRARFRQAAPTREQPSSLSAGDAVAKFNHGLQATPSKMVGEGVIPFLGRSIRPTPRFRAGKRGPIHLPLGLTIDPSGNVFELREGSRNNTGL